MGVAIVNKFMKMMGIGENETSEDEAEYYDEEDTENTDLESELPKSRRSFRDIEDSNPYTKTSSQAKIIPMNTGISSSKMVITQPTCFEDVQEISGYLKSKKSIIVNLENVSKEDARRIIDFLGGATFMVDGTMQNVSNLIYLITPKDVEIQNDIERSQYKQKLSFSWLK